MLISKMHYIPIPMTCDNACAIEKHNNESIASQGGAIEKHLMDSSHFTWKTSLRSWCSYTHCGGAIEKHLIYSLYGELVRLNCIMFLIIS